MDIDVENHPLVLEAQIYNYYYLLEKGEIEKATELATITYPYRKNVISEELSHSLVIGKVYGMILKQQNDDLKEYFSKIDVAEKHIFNESKNYEAIKTALYIFAFIDEDREGYAKVINDSSKAKEKYRYPRLIDAEEKLIKDTIKVVQELQPELNSK